MIVVIESCNSLGRWTPANPTLPLVVVAAVASCVSFHGSVALAGPAYSLDWMVFRADVIVEVELELPSKHLGWPAAARAAGSARIARTIYNREGVVLPERFVHLFPFSSASKCWRPTRLKRPVIRSLVFYSPNDDLMGLERNHGGYTSLNPRYTEVVEAIATATAWRSATRPDAGQFSAGEALKRRNAHLRHLAAVFLKSQGVSGVDTEPFKPGQDHPGWPRAECGAATNASDSEGGRPTRR